MKKLIFLFPILFFICLICSSFDIKDTDIFIIEVAGTKTGYVKIGDNNVKYAKGSTFRATDKVYLNPDEYIKARNIRTKQPIEVCYESFLEKNLPSGSSFIKLKMAGSKSADEFASFVSSNSPWYIIEDTVRIECHYKLNATDCGFILRTIPGGKELTPVPFDVETNELIFSSDYFFKENNISTENINSKKFKMEYWHNGKITPITDDLKFIFKPLYNNKQL